MGFGVYILKTGDGYRPALSDRFAYLIGRFDTTRGRYELVPEEVERVFLQAPVCASLQAAMEQARRLADTCDNLTDVVGYVISEAEHMTFDELICFRQDQFAKAVSGPRGESFFRILPRIRSRVLAYVMNFIRRKNQGNLPDLPSDRNSLLVVDGGKNGRV
ncbi:MAG: hypothetical protein RL768_1497 [Nitrospirota bacterium]|jgi:hypothetical protein